MLRRGKGFLFAQTATMGKDAILMQGTDTTKAETSHNISTFRRMKDLKLLHNLNRNSQTVDLHLGLHEEMHKSHDCDSFEQLNTSFVAPEAL